MGIRRVKQRPYAKPRQVISEQADDEALYSLARILRDEFGYELNIGSATVIEMISHRALRDPEFLKRAIPELTKRNSKKLPEELVNLPKD